MTADAESTTARNDYLPIEEHALIGNQYTAALVGRDGAIVWCCFPELQAGSVFASLLDGRKGGLFRVAPLDGAPRAQHYIDRTAVLVTSFDGPDGQLSVTDFMPLRGSIVGCEGPEGPPEIHRTLRCESGRVEVQVEWSPRFDYARARTTIERSENGYVARGGGEVMVLAGLQSGRVVDGEHGPEVRATIPLSNGEEIVLNRECSAP